MKINSVFTLAIAALVLAVTSLNAQSTNDVPPLQTQFVELVQKVQAKINTGKNTEADFADELKEFDNLMAAENGAKTDEAAQILSLKGQLYLIVIKDYEKAGAIYSQISTNYPGTRFAEEAAEIDRQISVQSIQENLVAGAKFPDFAENDLNGKPLSVSAFKGKVVLVDFWATWCPPCRAELPAIIKIYQKNHSKGLEIIGISLDTMRPQLDTFLKSTSDMTWPQYFDTEIGKRAADNPTPNLQFDNKLARKYGIVKIPSNFLIGPTGKIIAKDLHGRELENTIKVALEDK